MPIQFEKQKYQEECVNNIVELLQDYDFTRENLKECFENFYKNHNEIPEKRLSNKLNIDILMETGTGKTYTYIKTILELNKQYGLNKFVIFVPRKAIREGVIQNIKITADHFFGDYNKRIKLYTYSDKNSLSQIQQYIKQDELSVLLLTNSSIDRQGNILNQSTEFFPKSTLKEIQDIKPVIIIDEPHLLKGEKFSEVFKTFNGLYLRFGATFPKEEEHQLSNVAYTLDSISAFKENLVKKIRVHTIWTGKNDFELVSIKNKVATFNIVENNIGNKKQYWVGSSIGTDAIVKMDSKAVYLSSGKKYELRTTNYALNEQEQEFMIEKTIKEHFEKEGELFKQGIKTLSLFFIENIKNFQGNNAMIKKIFIKKYKEIRQEYYNGADKDYKKYLDDDYKDGELKVMGGYFSGSDSDDSNANKEIVDLILKDKEGLLSFKNPLRFIFTCWALQEGWDNPNIFNICKLSNTKAETSKRQQVGRGLRLAINQNGIRRTLKMCNNDDKKFYDINTLNVVVSGYENTFIEDIQREILEGSYTLASDKITIEILKHLEFTEMEASKIIYILNDNGVIDDEGIVKEPLKDFVENNREKFSKLTDERYKTLLEKISENKSIVENANKKRESVAIKPTYLEQFKELWKTINRKARMVYKDVRENEMLGEIAKRFNNDKINPVEIKIITKEYNAKTGEIEKKEEKSLGMQNFKIKTAYLIDFSKQYKLPLDFVLRLFNKLDRDNFKNNPKQAKDNLICYIQEVLHDKIIDVIGYNFENNVEIRPFDRNEIDSSWMLGYVGDDNTNPLFLYEKDVYDSALEKEIEHETTDKINNNKIIVFAKLPKLNIPTPYKTYNPDFAYYIEKGDSKKLFLVVESKGYEKYTQIPDSEKKKIEYAKKFFNDLNEEIKDIDIVYKTRINKQEMLTLLE